MVSTFLGHSLTGISIGLAAGITDPMQLSGLAIVANLPDLPIKGWGHDRYEVSHSIPLLSLAAGVLALASLWLGLGIMGLLAGITVLSHVLLDACYEHGQGIGCWWPISNARLQLFKIFKLMDTTDILGKQSQTAYWREIQVFSIVIMACLFVRRKLW